MSNNVGVYIYRIDVEIWIGFAKNHVKDGLDKRASEILNPVDNVLIVQNELEQESGISLVDYINQLAVSGVLNENMIPCSLGTFLEQAKPKREDKKRQWRMMFSCLGEDLDFSQGESNV